MTKEKKKYNKKKIQLDTHKFVHVHITNNKHEISCEEEDAEGETLINTRTKKGRDASKFLLHDKKGEA